MIPIARFLRFIKNFGPDQQLPCLKKITIDVSAAEHAASTGVFGSAVSIQRCLFHVSRAWVDQICKKVKLGNASAINAVHRRMIAALKSSMWESSTQMFTDMETNNYIESWHNQLKMNYLQRKRNRRLDFLIFILVDDVHANFMHNTARMIATIGRMSSETRKARKRMIAAEEINGLSLEDMVQKVYLEEGVCYIVKSFTTEVVYNISTEQGMMPACNCIDFQRNKRASNVDCHDSNKRNATVYLRHCLEINSSLRVHTMGGTALIQNTVENNHIKAVTDSSDALQSEVPSDADDRTDELLTGITNYIDLIGARLNLIQMHPTMLIKVDPPAFSKHDYLRVVWSNFFEYLFPASGNIKIKTGVIVPKFQFALPSTIANLDNYTDILSKLLTFRKSMYCIADTIEESLTTKHSVETALGRANNDEMNFDPRIYWIHDSYYTLPSNAKSALPTYLFGYAPPSSIMDRFLSLSHEKKIRPETYGLTSSNDNPIPDSGTIAQEFDTVIRNFDAAIQNSGTNTLNSDMATHDNRMVSYPTSVSRSQTHQGRVNDKNDFGLFWRQMESNFYKETGYTESCIDWVELYLSQTVSNSENLTEETLVPEASTSSETSNKSNDEEKRLSGTKKVLPAKIVPPSNRGIIITIIEAICKKGVIDLNLRNPKAVQKKSASNKKRKRDDGGAAEHRSNVMDILNEHGVFGRYPILDNAVIHKVPAVQELIESRGYKAVYLSPYSPFTI
ncbi:hypothetical protein G6F70_006360 [Rhizopus microsporus]|nr:hypothetical protein G6F71_006734 [Rhizopus microsporus]KAG1197786.1 hypothetical protein G6F70_006360 [Rhizopus microsporus]KAG1212324.1 hypothetical protein G6F69_003803 [Rhizopus microsporus]